MTVTTAKWTIEEYHQLVETVILDDKRVELLEGIIVDMPPEGMPHAVYCRVFRFRLIDDIPRLSIWR